MKQALQSLIQEHFPHSRVKHAFGYGSAVFSQANYQQKPKDQVVDMILVVDDTTRFHEENMSLNYSHYSGWAKRFPVGVTGSVNNALTGFYFNSNINLSTFPNVFSDQEVMRLKYGIIQKDVLIKDLTEWSSFAAAGRMQKPILDLVEDPEVVAANHTNRRNAILVSFFLQNELQVVREEDLIETLCGLSMKGDVRMLLGFENPNKIKNIARGNYDQLVELYKPIIDEIELIERTEQVDDCYRIRNPQKLQEFFEAVHPRLKKDLKPEVIQGSHADLKKFIQVNLNKVAFETSINLIGQSAYSTNPLKGFNYVLSKFKKGRMTS